MDRCTTKFVQKRKTTPDGHASHLPAALITPNTPPRLEEVLKFIPHSTLAFSAPHSAQLGLLAHSASHQPIHTDRSMQLIRCLSLQCVCLVRCLSLQDFPKLCHTNSVCSILTSKFSQHASTQGQNGSCKNLGTATCTTTASIRIPNCLHNFSTPVAAASLLRLLAKPYQIPMYI